jgi:predicted RNA-binding protein with PUA-like domain
VKKKGAAKRAGVRTAGTKKAGVSKATTKKSPRPAAKPEPETPPRAGSTGYWLVKSEPETFSFDDLLASPRGTTCWDGVRNYQARNFLRDGMRRGDLVLFYHSGDLPAVVGVAEVVREGYPDHTAFDPTHAHFDPKSSTEEPTWIMVDLRAREALPRPLTLADLRGEPALAEMVLLQRGSRLSVQPVREEEWRAIMRLAALTA